MKGGCNGGAMRVAELRRLLCSEEEEEEQEEAYFGARSSTHPSSCTVFALSFFPGSKP